MKPTQPKKTDNIKIPADLVKRLGQVKILVMDSSPRITGLFRAMLSEFGFINIFEANHALDGVSILREHFIHLIITEYDLQFIPPDDKDMIAGVLPSPSGIHFVRRLRCAPGSPSRFAPIIMLTDMVEASESAIARDAGVNEVCLKPLNAAELMARISAVIENPRPFVTAPNFRGPCRRRHTGPRPDGERRKREIRVVRYQEKGGGIK